MKNIFKKLSILALLTVCLLASSQTHAMEPDEKSLSLTTLGDSSLGMSSLQQSFISEVSQLTEEQMLMMSQMMSNMRQGDLSKSSIDFAATIYKQEFDKLNNNIQNPLWPANIHPAKMYDACANQGSRESYF